MVSKQRSQWTGVRPVAPTTRADWMTQVAPVAKAEASRPRASPAVVQPIERTQAGSLVRTSLDATSPVRMWSSAPSRRRGDCGFSRAEHAAGAPVDSINGLDDDKDIENVDDDSNQDADASHLDDGIAVTSNSNAASAANSRVAALNRELKALELRFFRTREQVEKTREQNQRLRRDVRVARTQCTKTERDAAKLRNLLDRLQADKKQLEAQAIANRDYAHKMEQRFFLGTKAQSLLECNLELHAQIQTLREQMRELQDERNSDQREVEDVRGRLALTQRALDLKIESFAPAANGSVHSSVLLELAKLQEQLAAMAKQLLNERGALRASETQQQRIQHEARELEQRLAEREALIATLEHDRATADEKLGRVVGDAQTLACEKATLLKFIQQQAEAKFQLDAQLKSVQDDKLRVCAAFHEKLERAVDEKHKVSERVRDLEREKDAQIQKLHAMANAFREQQDANRELQTRISAMIDDAQHEREQRRALDEELAAAKEVCRDLKLRLDDQTLQINALRAEVSRLDSAKVELEMQLSRKNDEQRALQKAMETALHDLEALSKQRNQAARAMNEAVTISASSLEEQQALEAAVERQRKQLEQLKSAKSLLQNAMLAQLSSLRKQLHVERARRVETEAKLTQMIKFSSTKVKHGDANCMPPLALKQQAMMENADIEGSNSSPSPPRSPSRFDEARIMLAPQSPPLPSPHSPPSLPASVASIQSPVVRAADGVSTTREELDAVVSGLAASPSSVSSSLSSSSSSLSSLSSEMAQREIVVEAITPVRDQSVFGPSRDSASTVEPQRHHLDPDSSCEQLSLLELAGDV